MPEAVEVESDVEAFFEKPLKIHLIWFLFSIMYLLREANRKTAARESEVLK